jgi:hypothetical protein
LGGDTYRFAIPADQLTLPYVIEGNQDGIVEGDETVLKTPEQLESDQKKGSI